jgi:peroxiredoxin Q/BCP
MRLRTIATTCVAVMQGVFSAATHREPSSRVTLQPGDRAPDFALRGSDGRTYHLAEVLGERPVVLAWFPKAFTGGCTAECRSIAESRPLLEPLGVARFGVSVDSPETNRAFAASMGIDFPILSDPDKTVARAYGVVGPSGFAARWTFYIGKDGRILAIDKQVRTAAHGADIAAALERMKIPGT